MQRIQFICQLKIPKRKQSKHYAEWKAENDGVLTARGMIKNDIDEAIATSISDKQFFYKLREKVITLNKEKTLPFVLLEKKEESRLLVILVKHTLIKLFVKEY